MVQVRKPSRLVGRLFTWIMNRSHSGVTDWGLGHVTVGKADVILDVGCGGGRTIKKLTAMAADGKVFGVDHAKGSVAASRAMNAALIEAGRVDVREASVSKLPFADAKFDLVTAVETQYYWPDMVNDMREIRRVLKPGGTLVTIAETYKNGSGSAWIEGGVMKLLRSKQLSVDEERELFAAAEFTDVQTFEEHKKRWLCVTGMKLPV